MVGGSNKNKKGRREFPPAFFVSPITNHQSPITIHHYFLTKSERENEYSKCMWSV